MDLYKVRRREGALDDTRSIRRADRAPFVAGEGAGHGALAVMPADGGIHDVDAHALAEVDRLQAVLGRQIGMAAEAWRRQAEPVHDALDATERLGVGFERDMLGPAADGAQLDELVACCGDSLERPLECVGVVAVGVAAQPNAIARSLR